MFPPTAVTAPLDEFEQFAVVELDAQIVEVPDDPEQYAADFCWWPGRGGAPPSPPSHPAQTLDHLLTVPQLPAPANVPLLPAVAAHSGTYERPNAATFEAWLDTDLGREVTRRILENRHSVSMDRSAAYFDTAEDVQQKALIWLWQRWDTDPGYATLARGATCLSHAAGCITKVAVMGARCKYAKRRREGREKQIDLHAADGYQSRQATRMAADTIRATDVHEHDRMGQGRDRKTDIRAAIERVVQKMVAHHSIAKGNYRRVPIEHITRTILEGVMYHYTDRYSQTGSFRQFCEAKGVSKNVISRWRPQIFDYLREELTAYAPAA